MSEISALAANLDQTMAADRHRLQRQLQQLGKQPDAQRQARWLEQFQRSCARVEARRASIPPMRFDDQLPIAERREQIREAIENNQVVIVAGETGSGKTTQIPKICLELGRGTRGADRAYQARRLAARRVATAY